MQLIFCLNFDNVFLSNSIRYDEKMEYFAEKSSITQILLLWYYAFICDVS
jgi:hypothetical protein